MDSGEQGMKYNPQLHNRKSARLKGYDYSSQGIYHVVLRVKNELCAFGKITASEMALSSVGLIAEQCWKEIPGHFSSVRLDQYVVMPNHIHGIIVIESSRNSSKTASQDVVPRKDVQLNVPTNEFSKTMSEISPKSKSLPVIVRTYKAAVTTRCRFAGFNAFEWQSRYYDHIIRDGTDLDRVRMYILNNPVNWARDQDNPRNIPMEPIHDEADCFSPLD